MCLIVKKTADQVIPTALLTDAFNRNSDGWGIMYAEDGEIITEKGFDLDDLIAAVATIQDNREIFLHMRMRTHGDVNEANLHPFWVTPDIAVMHNGILDNVEIAHKTESDTAAFVRMMQPMLAANPLLIFDEGWLALVSEFCAGSRLVFLHSSGRYSIIHENDGIEWEGLWASNTYSFTLWKNSSPKTPSAKVSTSARFRWDDDDLAYDWHVGKGDRSPQQSYTCDHDDVDPEDIDLAFLRSLDYSSLHSIVVEDPDLVIDCIYQG